VVKANPEQARVIFDDATADGLVLALEYRQKGMFDQALALETQIEARAPALSSCGAGSCGLAGVDNKEAALLKKQLGAESGDTVLKDEVRRCKCGSKSIIYAFNKKKVIKFCSNCENRTREDKSA
jgi:hypothetical protein